jgi:hypothetical protein
MRTLFKGPQGSGRYRECHFLPAPGRVGRKGEVDPFPDHQEMQCSDATTHRPGRRSYADS